MPIKCQMKKREGKPVPALFRLSFTPWQVSNYEGLPAENVFFCQESLRRDPVFSRHLHKVEDIPFSPTADGSSNFSAQLANLCQRNIPNLFGQLRQLQFECRAMISHLPDAALNLMRS